MDTTTSKKQITRRAHQVEQSTSNTVDSIKVMIKNTNECDALDTSTSCNIPKSIFDKLNKNLHKQPDHPIFIIAKILSKYFENLGYSVFDNLQKNVTVEDNFDKLLIPLSHPSRKKTDTYYLNDNTVLRTHMTCHSHSLLKSNKKFITIGDVYRKDEIDKCHYPIFHQLDGVFMINKDEDKEKSLKKILSDIIEFLFPKCEYRFNTDYFPFTEPSFEAEVLYNNKWLEILGAGILHKEITDDLENEYIAFGLGIDRLAMIFFEIPDIRLFWTSDNKFLNQFKYNDDLSIVNKFKPYSKIDPIDKDISFWIEEDEIEKINETEFNWNNVNSFYELVREYFGDDIECVKLIDSFYYKKKNKYSNAFRLTFSPTAELNSLAFFCETTNKKMEQFGEHLKNKLNVEVR